MVDLDEDFPLFAMDRINQSLKRRDLFIRIDQRHLWKGPSLSQDARMFHRHIAHAASHPPQVVGDMPLIDSSILAGEMSGHWRHDYPIFHFQFSDLERAEEVFETSH
jgi:hypothetical protein